MVPGWGRVPVRPLVIVVGFAFAAIAGLLGSSGEAEAHTIKGVALTDTDNAGAGNRCHWIATSNGVNTCGAISDAIHADSFGSTWEMDAGACLTLTYRTGVTGVPPAVPNKMTIEVRQDNVATVVKTLHGPLTAPPADLATFSFCATGNGNAGGALRAGTYRLFIRAVKDDGPGGVGNYDTDSDTQGHRGALRGRAFVSSIVSSSPPSGSFFAYSVANEQATLTTTHTIPNTDQGLETIRHVTARTSDMNTALETLNAVDADGSAQSQMTTIDNTYPLPPGAPGVSPVSIGTRFEIVGNAALTNGQAAFVGDEQKWTIFAASGHGADIVRVSDTRVQDTVTFLEDRRLMVDSHVYIVEPRVDDDWPAENATEDSVAVIGADTAHLDCHVANARFEDQDTGPDQVTLSFIDPDTVVRATAQRQTDGTGWTGTNLDFAAAPPAGFWVARCAVTLTNNARTVDATISFISAFTGDLGVRIFLDPDPERSNETELRFYVQVERRGSPIEPDMVPTFTLGRVVGDVVVEKVLNESMLNVVDDTATVNGPLYYGDIEWESTDELVVWSVRAAVVIDGAPIQGYAALELGDGVVIGGLATGEALEAAFWLGVAFFAFWRGWPMVAMHGTQAMIGGLVVANGGTWPINTVGSLVFLVVLLWLHALAWPKDWSIFGIRRERENSG